MEQRPSDRELEEQMKKTVNELKFRGIYDDIRKQLLGKVEDDSDYRDLLQRVKDFSNRFFHKNRYVEGEKGIIRQRLKTGINDSNNISRYTANLAHDMINEIEDHLVKDYIRAEVEKYLGLDCPNGPSTSERKGRFENTFVQEESSNTSSSFVAARNAQHSFLGNEAENSNVSSNKNEDSIEPFSNQVSFLLTKPAILAMDKISDDEDSNIDDLSLPSPPKIEQFSPQKVEIVSTSISCSYESNIPEIQSAEISFESTTILDFKEIQNVQTQVDQNHETIDGDRQSSQDLKRKEPVSSSYSPEMMSKKIKFENDEKKELPKRPNVSDSTTPQKSRASRDTKSHAEASLDLFIIEDSKNNYEECSISDVSSVHSSDLSDFNEQIFFSDSDFEDLNGFSIETLRLAFDDPQKFVGIVERLNQENKAVNDDPKEQTKKPLPSSRKKNPVKRQTSKDSVTIRRSRRRNISTSTDSSIPSKTRVETPDSSISTTGKLKRNRTDSQCSTDGSTTPNKRSKVSRKQQQSYDASDLYKPRTSTRSNRRSARGSSANSPLSTASNSTT